MRSEQNILLSSLLALFLTKYWNIENDIWTHYIAKLMYILLWSISMCNFLFVADVGNSKNDILTVDCNPFVSYIESLLLV